MLECSHISIEHRESGRPLLHDFSFTLHPGDRVALIGEEGNGKSTLLKLICEPEAIRSYCHVSGRIELHARCPAICRKGRIQPFSIHLCMNYFQMGRIII